MEDNFQGKMTSKYTAGRILLKFETQAIEIKPECAKVSNEDELQQWKMTSSRRQPQNMKVEYLCNHWLDLTQILT